LWFREEKMGFAYSHTWPMPALLKGLTPETGTHGIKI